jgi:hypothetical protein
VLEGVKDIPHPKMRVLVGGLQGVRILS